MLWFKLAFISRFPWGLLFARSWRRYLFNSHACFLALWLVHFLILLFAMNWISFGIHLIAILKIVWNRVTTIYFWSSGCVFSSAACDPTGPLLFDLFVEIEIDWSSVIENEIILLMMPLTLRFRILWLQWTCTHYIDIGATMVDVHDVVYYFHVLRIIRWISIIILPTLILNHMIIMILSIWVCNLLSIRTTSCCLTALICIVIGLICLHVDLIVELLRAILLVSIAIICVHIAQYCIVSTSVSNQAAWSEFDTIFQWGLTDHIERAGAQATWTCSTADWHSIIEVVPCCSFESTSLGLRVREIARALIVMIVGVEAATQVWTNAWELLFLNH